MPKSIGPVRSSRYYYIAWAAEWRAIYAHSGGSPGALQTLRAKGSGQYVYNVDEFRYSGTFHRLQTRSSPHNLYTTSAKLRSLGKKIGAKDKAYKTVWQFAPDAPLEARPYGGTITVKYPYNTITYKYDRKTNTYLRSVTGEKKQTDAANDTRVAPKNVVIMRMRFGPLNDGHPGAPRLEADGRRQRSGLDLDQRPDDQGHLEEDLGHQADQVLRRGRGNEVTLTVGQTFVQVITTSTTGYPISFKKGSDTPPATRRPERLSQLSCRSAAAVRPVPRLPDRRVDRPGLARHVGPGAGVRLGSLAGGGGDPVVDAVIGPQRRQRDGEPLRVARLDQQPGRTDQLGEWPDR